MVDYHFGIEIEVIVRPHKVRPSLESLSALYYGKIAASLRKRGLQAQADSLEGRYRNRPEHYDKWWITSDGSLGNPTGKISMEAVSPVMSCQGDWESEIDTFWTAMRVVFHMPERSPQCGSHIHVSRDLGRPFTLPQLKTIAFGVVLYEPLILQLLMPTRANNQFCQRNTLYSTQLAGCNSDRNMIAQLINSAENTTSLCSIMQNNKYVLWNFENILPGKSGTVEFRGGRCLRGEVRTKRWIACTISLIDAILRMNNLSDPTNITLSNWSPDALYIAVKQSSERLLLRDSLPNDYRVLNESQR